LWLRGSRRRIFGKFFPTIKVESLRVVLAIAAHEDREARQIDVINVYARSDLHETVYSKPIESLKYPAGKVLLIKKALYRLKPLGRE
jgi:hypothetical protein